MEIHTTDIIDMPMLDKSKLGLLINVHCKGDDVLSGDFVKKAESLVKKHKEERHDAYAVVCWHHSEGRNIRIWKYEDGVLERCE